MSATTMKQNHMKVPYVNLSLQHLPIKQELLDAVAGVIDRGDFVLGGKIAEFETQFAALCGVRYAVGLNSGTDALIFALRAYGIGPGDEVITPANSFMTTTSAIVLAGAVPVFVDVRSDYMIDPGLIEKAITPKTKAIMPVHLTGKPADMAPIMDVARRHGLKVIEDCAQAVSAEYAGKKVGSLGDTGCFSLHPLKTLNACGDGGVLTTNDARVYEQARILRNNGFLNRDECVAWSSNSRLDTLQAAIILVKMKYLEAWTCARIKNAAFYRSALAGTDGIRLPEESPNTRSVYHTFVVQADDRENLRTFLLERGIETKIHYPIPIHLQKVCAGLGFPEGSLPETEQQGKRILSLPVYPELTQEQLQHVADSIHAFYKGER